MKELRLSTGRRIVVKYDESCDVDNPRNYDPVSKLIGLKSSKYSLFDETFDSIESLYEERDEALKRGDFVFNLYIYDHSMISLSIEPFNDIWDSGLIGFCIVAKAEGIYNETRAKELAEYGLKVFTQWINGEVFEVLVAHPDGFDTVIDDSIGGCFIDNEDDLRDVLEGLDLTEGERRETLDNIDKLMS